MTPSALVERFDPNDDTDALLRRSDRLLASVRKAPSAPLPRADLEAVAQQLARRLGGETQEVLGRVPRGPRGPRPSRGGWRGPGPWRGRVWVDEVLLEPDSELEEDEVNLGRAGGANRASALAEEPKGLLDVFDPKHNLREMSKELLLLEDHLAQPAKHCPDCIRKHLLKTEALAEEAVQLDEDGTQQARLGPLPGQVRNLSRDFLAGTDRNALQQQVRQLRKSLAKESFGALSFRPSAPSTHRTPVVFALARGKDEATLGAEAPAAAPLPSTVAAALRRRIEAGLERTPAPVFVRQPNADGTTTILEGKATGAPGERDLLVQTDEDVPRTLRVPRADVVLDLSADPAFTAIPWPESIPVTRNGKTELVSIRPDTRAWRNIRLIASVLWPVVDSFALRHAGTSVAARRSILQRLLLAAVVNAIYESNLDASVEGDKGRAVGLFQLRDDGAGQGMSKASRKDPMLNTARIAQRMLETRSFFAPTAEAEGTKPGSTSPSTWTALFARYVEAPSNKEEAERMRGDSAAAAFARDMPVRTPAPPSVVTPVPPESSNPLPWIVGGLAVTSLAIGLGMRVLRDRG